MQIIYYREANFFLEKIHLSMNGRRTNHIINGEKKTRSNIKGEWHKAIRLAYVAFNLQYSPTGGPGRSQQHSDGERRCGPGICSRRKEWVVCGELVEAHGLHQPSSLLTCASSSMGGRALRAAMTSTASTPHGVAAPPRSALTARSSCASPLACCQPKLQLWRPAGWASTPVGTSFGDTSHWRGTRMMVRRGRVEVVDERARGGDDNCNYW